LDKINHQSITSPEPCIAFRVDLPKGDYSLVPVAEEGDAEAALQYVEVLDDTEGAQANLADEGKPRCMRPNFSNLIYNYLCVLVHLSSGVVWNLRCMIPRYQCPY
jgi:hypothetical protein